MKDLVYVAFRPGLSVIVENKMDGGVVSPW